MSTYSQLDLNILKCITQDKSKAIEFCANAKPEIFEENLWNFSNMIISYINSYKDLPTLKIFKEKLIKNATLQKHIEDVWGEINNVVFDDKEFYVEVEKLQKRFAANKILNLKSKLENLDSSNIDIEKEKKNIERSLFDIKSIGKKKTYTNRTAKDYLNDFYGNYKAKLQDPDFDKGVSTGFSYLDYVSDGLRPGELFLVGGETSSGKSVMLNSMAVQMWMQQNSLTTLKDHSKGHNILYFSLEMPLKNCYNRFLGKLGELNLKKLRAAKLNSQEIEKLKLTMNFIKNYPYTFEIIDMARDATIEHIQKVYDDAKTRYEPEIVVIDYLGLMSNEGNNSDAPDHLALGKIAEQLHEFARVNNTIVLSAVQLNRMKPSKDTPTEESVGIHRIGRSSMILHNANICIQLLKRPNESNYTTGEYFVIKNRDGELGKGSYRKMFQFGAMSDNDDKENFTNFQDYDPDDISDVDLEF